MNLNVTIDPAAAKSAIEQAWIARAKAQYLKPKSAAYRKAEVEFFCGAMAAMNAVKDSPASRLRISSGLPLRGSISAKDVPESRALAAQTTRTYNHTGRANSTTYHYRVRANVTGGSSSPYAGPVSATTLSAIPTTPNTVRVTRSGNNVTVTWSDRSNNETGFEIGRQTLVGTTWQAIVPGIGNVGANVATFTHTATAGTYRYVVRAKTATNQSAWSGASASITVP